MKVDSMTKECIICGKVFNHTTRGNRAVTCSNECRKERRKHTDRKRDRVEYWKERSSTNEYRERNKENNSKYRQTEKYKILYKEREEYRKQYYEDNKELIDKLRREKELKLAIEQNKATNITIIKCKDCGTYEVIRGKSNRGICSRCLYNYKSNLAYYKNKKQSNCRVCGKEFYRTRLKHYCSDECRSAVLDKARKSRSGSVRKRCRKAGVYYEPVNRLKVFDRDKWRCVNCRCKVHTNDRLKDNAAEVDHIVPISKGGPNTYSNVQTLCRKCNQTKNNSYEGQLILSL